MGQPERGSCDLAMVSCFLHPFLIKKHYSCIEMFDGVSHWFFFSYTVNITFGICSCMVGKDSSPCKHQYVLWVTNVGHCINFIPVFSVCLDFSVSSVYVESDRKNGMQSPHIKVSHISLSMILQLIPFCQKRY